MDDLPQMLDRVDHIAGTGFALGADHARALGDAPESFAQVASAADKGNIKSVLIDVMSFIGGREHFGFVNVVHAQFLENLGFREVSDAAFGHDGNRNRLHDLADDLRRRHAGHAALGAYLRRNTLQGHDRGGAGGFSDFGLVGVGHVHNDAALEHFSEAGFEPDSGTAVFFRH